MPTPKPPHQIAPTSARHKRELEEARSEGALDALEEFQPAVKEQIRRGQELLPTLMDTIESCIRTQDFDSLKAITPTLKLFVDQNERLFKMTVPKQVVRTEAKIDQNLKVQQTVVHTSLGELLKRENTIEGKAL